MLIPVKAPVASLGDDERSLIARVVAGDRTAARVLYDAHAARVHRLAYRICRDPGLADDLTQDVFVQVFRKLETFRGDSSFSTWLHRVTVTTCLNTLRKVNRHASRERELDESHHGFAVPAESDGGDLRQALTQAIDGLPDPLRVPLVMYHLEGFSHGEIGEALGIAEGTSKRRVFDARARLRVALAEHQEAP
ncbi:MAG: RNA polymerase sigma factor [Gemmatimonadota bacterium]